MKPSELAWKLSDYSTAGMEPPARALSNPDLTEGQMMSDDEIEEFIKDSIATLRVLSDHHSDRYQAIAQTFHTDLAYLTALGRIDDEQYNDLINPDNLHF